MAVPAGPTEIRYLGNGATTVFAVPFLVIQASDLAVYMDGVQLTSGYTQSGVGNPTSTVTFTLPPTNLAQILFQLDVPFERLNDYQENGDFLASTVNRDFDRIWQALKQLYRFSTRSLTLGFFDVDGAGWYRAKGNGIRDLADPTAPQDAATKHSVEAYVTGILQTGQGPINNASNVVYVTGDGDVTSVQKGIRRTFSSISALVGKDGQINKEMISVTAYHDGWAATGDGPLGGGDYIWDALRPKTAHNGGTVISPTVPWSGSQATLSAFLAGAGETFPAGLGCWVLSRNVQINPFVFGAKGDDVADDTASVQKMLNTLPLSRRKGVIPRTPVAFRVTAPLLVSKSLQLEGDGCDLYNATIINNQNVRGPGSWIHFAHTGKGFDFQASSGELTGVVMKGFGTYRDHAVPGAGWIPTAHDYDFNCTSVNGDYTFKDLVLWNPTNGFWLNGRCTLADIKMQPLKNGIRTELCADTLRVNNVHCWPFWSTHTSVKSYMLSNLSFLFLTKTDNPIISGVFSLWAYTGLRISQTAAGSVGKLRLSDFDFDAGQYGIYIDSSVTNGATLQITNGVTQGEAGQPNSMGIFIQGNGSHIEISNMLCSDTQLNSLRIEGTNNQVNMVNFRPRNWNQSGAGFFAIEVAATNYLNNSSRMDLSGSVGTLFGGAGSINSPLSSGVFSGTTNAIGQLVVPHNAKATPTIVFAQLKGPDLGLTVRVDTIDGTNFTLKIRDASGAIYANSSIQIFWNAEMTY